MGMNKKLRLILSGLIILATLGALVYYISKHQNLLTKLAHTPLSVILLILVLYGLWLLSLVLILQAILYLFHKTIAVSDNILLNAYSLFANFFIPGQAGPALRGVYLKRQHNVRYRDYIYGMLLYYFFYGVTSVVLLLAGSRPWWQTCLAFLIAVGVGALCFNWYTRRLKAKGVGSLRLKRSAFLLVATLLQSVVQIAIYFVEVHTVDRGVVLHQIITYTGAAQLALFVGLTPGAIGIRESFLIFTEHLHHISSSIIIEANVIDRAVYLVFLGLLFLLILSMHANKKFKVSARPDSARAGEPAASDYARK
jgi:uncharacterized membrane protein YbhN (UPF0104 family)